MKLRSIIVAGCLAACLWPGPSALSGQSVEHVKNLQLKKKGTGKSVASFLMGKKKQADIKPTSICRVTPDRLCLTDSVNGAVLIIDNTGKIIKTIARVKGLRLSSPVSVCVDDHGDLYVSDSANQVVLQFGPKYKFKKVFILQPDARITGIAFRGETFYGVDTPNHRILCFDREGRFLRAFGGRGTAEGRFNYPTHIAADGQYLYITDAMNFRVQVFTHTGKFVRTFGSAGRRGGNFSKPKGVAVDKHQRVFVTDAMFDNVQLFDKEGRFLHFFGGPGNQPSEFWMPLGIMIDTDGAIWVADTYNQRIQVFKLLENQP